MHHYGPDRIRNIALVSHSGAGKTTLAESLLLTTSAVGRLGNVSDGNTVSDFEPEEIKRKISLSLSVLPCQWQDTKINIIDTPGYFDFGGEVMAGLNVCEGVVVLVCAASRVEVGTENVWSYAQEGSLPSLIVINKMDRENANFEGSLEEIQNRLSKQCLAFQYPIGSQKDFSGFVDLFTLKAYGVGLQEITVNSELMEKCRSYRDKLIEAVVEIDDELLSKYLEGQDIGINEIMNAARRSVTQRKVTPVLVASGLKNIGVYQLLDAIVGFLPTPLDRGKVTVKGQNNSEERIEPKNESALTAIVFKTSADPHIGRLSYIRVYSGAIASNSQIWNSTKSTLERIGQLFMLRGKNQEAINQLGAGDIGVVAKLSVTTTGDTFGVKEHPVTLPSIKFLIPMLSMAVYPKSKADLDKMSTVLPKLCEEDPTLSLKREADTNEIILSGLGDTHLEVAAEKMHRKFGVEVKLEIPKVPYKETVMSQSTAEYKHKKQTGGHGQYGHVLLEITPLPRGSGFEFTQRVVGGSVPRNYIPAVEKGVNESRMEGILAGFPVVDVRVNLFGGSSHAVDSSEMAFKIAAAQALKKGLSSAQSALLEPIVNLTVSVPENFTGDVMSDLNTRRGRVLGMERNGEASIIKAQVPLSETQRYAIELRSITHGRGSYYVEPSHYEEVPVHITQKIVNERQAVKSEKD